MRILFLSLCLLFCGAQLAGAQTFNAVPEMRFATMGTASITLGLNELILEPAGQKMNLKIELGIGSPWAGTLTKGTGAGEVRIYHDAVYPGWHPKRNQKVSPLAQGLEGYVSSWEGITLPAGYTTISPRLAHDANYYSPGVGRGYIAFYLSGSNVPRIALDASHITNGGPFKLWAVVSGWITYSGWPLDTLTGDCITSTAFSC